MFDADLQPLLEPAPTALGRRLSDIFSTSAAAALALTRTVQGTETEWLTVAGLRIALLPIGGGDAARLVLAVGASELLLTPEDDARLAERLERIGMAIKTTIELEMSTAARLAEERQRSRRLEAALRFVPYLIDCPSERDSFSTLVHAAAVWYDVDARIYRRDSADVFRLEALAPGACIDDAPRQFPASLVRDHDGVCVRLSSWIELEQFGWPETISEVTLVPIGPVQRPTHIIALAGDVGGEAEAVFAALAHVYAGCLERYAAQRLQALERWLTDRMLSDDESMAVVMTRLLTEVGRSIAADSGDVVINDHIAAGPSIVASFGGVPDRLDSEWGRGEATGHRVAVPIRVRGGGGIVEFRTAAEPGFAPVSASIARGASRLLEVWLAGAWKTLPTPVWSPANVAASQVSDASPKCAE
jgi:hypothetical protein